MMTHSHTRKLVRQARDEVLRRYVEQGSASGKSVDAGMAVVADILTDEGESELAQLVLHRWLAGFRSGVSGYGLFADGLAGLLAGLSYAVALEPKLAGLSGTTRERLEGVGVWPTLAN